MRVVTATTPPATLTPTMTPAASKRQRLEKVLARYEITIADAHELAALEDYEIVIIADDSGSMNCSALPPEMRKLGSHGPTRWEELQHTMSEIVELASCFDDSGVDIFFLNRPPILGVRCTVADPRFRQAFAARFAKAIRKLLDSDSTSRLRVQIMACTGNDSDIGWLNKLDSELDELDVTDDYYTESSEVVRAGLAKRFTRGDWLMKAMLGPISAKFDKWDEVLNPTPECGCLMQ
eukprot:CAMPEP_0176151558 /NCGR_PEP_ID=MMETSP0120_2-20121206/77401_1 /TAXON_ID=160619 /ORGANISM="Kryptoperidinium foliaceum, Strain CCMP 1326" /LENGTH=235 /DNA_ID=CAMNT_0017488535 /DNA_START=14 /DNA_END=721 /DNA_ORIENTATION=+